jgi:hypothetical protein
MPGYQTKQQTVTIAGADDLVIRSLLDRSSSATRWATRTAGHLVGHLAAVRLLWPSGAQLAARMALHGAATPVSASWRSAAAWHWPAWWATGAAADVTASDCHPLAARFLAAQPAPERAAADEVPPRPWGAGAARRARRRSVPTTAVLRAASS